MSSETECFLDETGQQTCHTALAMNLTTGAQFAAMWLELEHFPPKNKPTLLSVDQYHLQS